MKMVDINENVPYKGRTEGFWVPFPLRAHVCFSGPALRPVLLLMPGISFKWCPPNLRGTIINVTSSVFHTDHGCPHCSLLLSVASVRRPNTKGALRTEEDDPELYKWAWETTIQLPKAAIGYVSWLWNCVWSTTVPQSSLPHDSAAAAVWQELESKQEKRVVDTGK